MKKKIFFLINSLEMGGAERVLSEITPELSKKYDITIYTLKESKSFYNLDVKTISLTKARTNLAMLISIPIVIKRFKKIIRENQPHRVLSFLELSNFVNILCHDKAIISFRTSFHFFKGIKGSIYKYYIKKLYPKSELIIVNSQENKEDITRKIPVNPKKVIVIYNPINIQKIKELKKEKTTKSFDTFITQKKIIITVGRLMPEKHQDRIIDAFKVVLKKDPSYALIILGDGPLKKKIEKEIVDTNMTQSIKIISGENNVFKYLNHAKYFVYASEAEGFPNVLLEAMAINIPIITTDFKTGARELIDPALSFDKKIKYPYYGPNGAIISLEEFEEKFLNVLGNEKLRQKRIGLSRFEKNSVLKDWSKIL